MNFQQTLILSVFLNILDILEHLARQNILAGTECQLLEKQITRPSGDSVKKYGVNIPNSKSKSKY